MTAQRLTAVLALAAAVLIIAGVVLLAGAAWGLITGGVLALLAAVTLYDPTPEKRRQ